MYKYYGIGTGWGCEVERESRHTEDKEEAMEKAETGVEGGEIRERKCQRMSTSRSRVKSNVLGTKEM